MTLKSLLAGLLAGTVIACPLTFAGEAANGEGEKPKADGERRERPDRGADKRNEGDRRERIERARLDGREGGPQAWAANATAGFGGRSADLTSMASRMLGIDIEDPKQPFKTENLPLGAEKRFILKVPVGGVDNPGAGNGIGWNVENVFKLTDEQTKSLETVRDEYKTERKKLDDELLAQLKSMAEKVKELRTKYELRANDVLTGEDKAAKEKMDALSRELQTKNLAVIQEIHPLFDANDLQQGMAMMRMIREKTSGNVREAETKLLELIPEASRERFSEIMARQSEQREQFNRFMGPGGGQTMRRGADRGPNAGAEGGDRPERDVRERGDRKEKGEAVKPPRPPEADTKGDF